jgi:hypothetical protein
MEEIPLFNPYTMSDDQILKVQTGQDTHVKNTTSGFLPLSIVRMVE